MSYLNLIPQINNTESLGSSSNAFSTGNFFESITINNTTGDGNYGVLNLGGVYSDTPTYNIVLNNVPSTGKGSCGFQFNGFDGTNPQTSYIIGGFALALQPPAAFPGVVIQAVSNGIAQLVTTGGVSWGYSQGSTPFSFTSSIGQNTYFIGINSISSSPNNTVTLPLLSNLLKTQGTIVVIKDETGTANTNNIVINTSDSTTIDGASTFTITQAYGSVSLYCNGSNWFIY